VYVSKRSDSCDFVLLAFRCTSRNRDDGGGCGTTKYGETYRQRKCFCAGSRVFVSRSYFVRTNGLVRIMLIGGSW